MARSMGRADFLRLCFGLGVYLTIVSSKFDFGLSCTKSCKSSAQSGTLSCKCTYEQSDFSDGHLVCGKDVADPADIYSATGNFFLLLTPDNDAAAVCQLSAFSSLKISLVVTIAQGPDTVTLQAYHVRDEDGRPVSFYYCHPSEMNPMRPDMVRWTGACEDQGGGFTCQVDAQEMGRVSCAVTNFYNGKTVESLPIETNFIIHPPRPFHNCSDVGSYIPESSTVPCVCSSLTSGSSFSNLVWMTKDGKILNEGHVGITELPLPIDVLTRANDNTQILCEAKGTESVESVTLSLHIAYGPDMVDLQMYHGISDSGEPFVVFYCQVNGMNPLTPDMVQWLGACEEQEGGFTCQVDPRVVTTEVGCRVINRYNNDHKVDSEMMEAKFTTIATPEQSLGMAEVRRAVAGVVSAVILAALLGCFLTAYSCRKRTKNSPRPPAEENRGRYPATRFNSSTWQYQRDSRNYRIVRPTFQRY